MAELRRRSKRIREEDDITSESAAPLAKRINDLHLSKPTNEVGSSNRTRRQRRTKNKSYSNDLSASHDGNDANANISDPNVVNATNVRNNIPAVEPVKQEQYNPEMDETENPYYYQTNKLLHYLHMERLRRT